MDTEVRERVVNLLYGTFDEIQRKRGAYLGTPIRSFVEQMVLESLETRQNEWQGQPKLDPSDPADAEEIASTVDKAVRKILDEAALHTPAHGRGQVSLIGVVEQVHKQYCGIFPLCR